MWWEVWKWILIIKDPCRTVIVKGLKEDRESCLYDEKERTEWKIIFVAGKSADWVSTEKYLPPLTTDICTLFSSIFQRNDNRTRWPCSFNLLPPLEARQNFLGGKWRRKGRKKGSNSLRVIETRSDSSIIERYVSRYTRLKAMKPHESFGKPVAETNHERHVGSWYPCESRTLLTRDKVFDEAQRIVKRWQTIVKATNEGGAKRVEKERRRTEKGQKWQTRWSNAFSRSSRREARRSEYFLARDISRSISHGTDDEFSRWTRAPRGNYVGSGKEANVST